LKKIIAATVSSGGIEFLLHVPTDNDYRYASGNK